MFRRRNPDEEEPEEDEDIAEVQIRGKKIKLGQTWYSLIMLYECPIDHMPLIAYWKITNGRADPNTVGRALRDSGFGGYRFFETQDGQGFEYDPEKDPRNRHQHGVKKESSYYYRPQDEFESLYLLFLKLNPVYSLNDFFLKLLTAYNSNYPKDHQFVDNQALAVKLIARMKRLPEIFLVIDDKLKHGKSIFYFELVQWESTTKYMNTRGEKVLKLHDWFGNMMDQVNTEPPVEDVEDDGDDHY